MTISTNNNQSKAWLIALRDIYFQKSVVLQSFLPRHLLLTCTESSIGNQNECQIMLFKWSAWAVGPEGIVLVK
jgi:hypothetical protein